jgi:hypothetical protein
MAQQAYDDEVKRELEELAKGWQHLAEYAERTSQTVRFVSRRTDGDE